MDPAGKDVAALGGAEQGFERGLPGVLSHPEIQGSSAKGVLLTIDTLHHRVHVYICTTPSQFLCFGYIRSS